MVGLFLGELCPFNFEKKGNFQFTFMISQTVVHIQLTFDIWVRQQNAQVKIEFGHGSKYFGRVMPPLDLKKEKKFSVSVYYLPNSCTHSTQI
jgi:hypothetical protein